jgi:hypothetical protein
MCHRLNRQAQVLREVERGVSDHPCHGTSPMRGSVISHRHGAYQTQTHEDTHAAGVRTLMAGPPSCARATIDLPRRPDHEYPMGLGAFSQSP